MEIKQEARGTEAEQRSVTVQVQGQTGPEGEATYLGSNSAQHGEGEEAQGCPYL